MPRKSTGKGCCHFEISTSFCRNSQRAAKASAKMLARSGSPKCACSKIARTSSLQQFSAERFSVCKPSFARASCACCVAANGLAGASASALILEAYWSNQRLGKADPFQRHRVTDRTKITEVAILIANQIVEKHHLLQRLSNIRDAQLFTARTISSRHSTR